MARSLRRQTGQGQHMTMSASSRKMQKQRKVESSKRKKGAKAKRKTKREAKGEMTEMSTGITDTDGSYFEIMEALCMNDASMAISEQCDPDYLPNMRGVQRGQVGTYARLAMQPSRSVGAIRAACALLVSPEVVADDDRNVLMTQVGHTAMTDVGRASILQANVIQHITLLLLDPALVQTAFATVVVLLQTKDKPLQERICEELMDAMILKRIVTAMECSKDAVARFHALRVIIAIISIHEVRKTAVCATEGLLDQVSRVMVKGDTEAACLAVEVFQALCVSQGYVCKARVGALAATGVVGAVARRLHRGEVDFVRAVLPIVQHINTNHVHVFFHAFANAGGVSALATMASLLSAVDEHNGGSKRFLDSLNAVVAGCTRVYGMEAANLDVGWHVRGGGLAKTLPRAHVVRPERR